MHGDACQKCVVLEERVLSLEHEKTQLEEALSEAKKGNDALIKAIEAYRVLAYLDAKTLLPNYLSFIGFLGREIDRARRYSTPLSLAMLDIDHFKRVNDEYGHQEGDQVLKKLGEILIQFCRKTDRIARYGGEEFTVLMPHTDRAGARILMDRLRSQIERELIITTRLGISVRCTVSIGVSQYSKEKTADEFIVAVDEALYVAKDRGRNRLEVA